MKKVCVVTGTRAEYGLLKSLIRQIKEHSDLELQLIVTGMHLSEEFGNTYENILDDGFEISRKVTMLNEGDSAHEVCQSIARGLIGFSLAFRELKPDIVLVLGDRYEILACAQAAMVNCIPIAHIHGGEATEGVIDEAIRHSVSKMSHLHFTATDAYMRRVIQLGENPKYVYNVGAMGVECIKRTQLLSKEALSADLGFDISGKLILMTYHPETLSHQTMAAFSEVISALRFLKDYKIIATYPNSDTGGRAIIDSLNAFHGEESDRIFLSKSLGQKRYFSIMKLSECVLGNSSSGLIEAPILGIPTVNIGDRQKGRFKAESVIQCTAEKNAIIAAVEKAVSRVFLENISTMECPYGDGDSAAKIVEILLSVNLNGILKKSFYNLLVVE